MVLLFGGAELYLTVQVWYLFRLAGHVSRSRMFALAGLAVAATISVALPAVMALLLAALVLVSLCAAILGNSRKPSAPTP